LVRRERGKKFVSEGVGRAQGAKSYSRSALDGRDWGRKTQEKRRLIALVMEGLLGETDGGG